MMMDKIILDMFEAEMKLDDVPSFWREFHELLRKYCGDNWMYSIGTETYKTKVFKRRNVNNYE